MKVTVVPARLLTFVIGAGTVITGGVVSGALTVNDTVDVFPASSWALQFTVVVAIEKVEPDAGVQLNVTDVSTTSQADAE